jgi:hypothetical protein
MPWRCAHIAGCAASCPHDRAATPYILYATTIGEIDAAFATLARERSDTLFVAGDTFFACRRVQFCHVGARDRRPIAIDPSEIVIAFAGAAKKSRESALNCVRQELSDV